MLLVCFDYLCYFFKDYGLNNVTMSFFSNMKYAFSSSTRSGVRSKEDFSYNIKNEEFLFKFQNVSELPEQNHYDYD